MAAERDLQSVLTPMEAALRETQDPRQDTIIVVESETIVGTAIERALKRGSTGLFPHLDVQKFSSVREAIHQILVKFSQRVALILVEAGDALSPDDKYTKAERVACGAASDIRNTIPLVLTVNGDFDYLARRGPKDIAAGRIDGILQKPFGVEGVAAEIQDAIARRNGRFEMEQSHLRAELITEFTEEFRLAAVKCRVKMADFRFFPKDGAETAEGTLEDDLKVITGIFDRLEELVSVFAQITKGDASELYNLVTILYPHSPKDVDELSAQITSNSTKFVPRLLGRAFLDLNNLLSPLKMYLEFVTKGLTRKLTNEVDPEIRKALEADLESLEVVEREVNVMIRVTADYGELNNTRWRKRAKRRTTDLPPASMEKGATESSAGVNEEEGVEAVVTSKPGGLETRELFKGVRFCIIDDEALVASGLARILEALGAEKSLIVENMQELEREVRELSNQDSVDVVMLDNSLAEGIKGHQLIPRLQELFPGALIICNTSEAGKINQLADNPYAPLNVPVMDKIGGRGREIYEDLKMLAETTRMGLQEKNRRMLAKRILIP